MMHKIEKCPVCGSDNFKKFISCVDYTVSKEVFDIVNCSTCNFKFTNPRPDDVTIGSYYKSEDYISHSNTKKGLISRLYHMVRTYTLKKKVSLVSDYVSRGTILDYGCGTGMFLNAAKENGWNTIGMEPDGGARQIAKGMDLNVFENKTVLEEATNTTKVDAITLWHVLEHVTNLDETLNYFKHKLNNNGVLIIAVPNYTSYDAKYYKEFWAAYDVPRHIYHFEINSISKLLSSFGFKLITTRPMKFDSFYVSMLSEKYKTGSINYISAFITGLLSNLKAKQAKDYSSVIYVFKKI